MKRVLLISPYFTPSNLAGVQRTRLLAGRLREFGWETVVVTVKPEYYEEANDDASLALLPEGLRIERVEAWPAKICRPLGVGDISLRAQWTMRRKVGELARRGEADLVFATVLPGYSSLVGVWAKRKFCLPFVLDYQDPWVSEWGAAQPILSKAGLAHWLATKLEARVVPHADALTAVSDETLDTLRARGLIAKKTPIEILPIGADREDHEVAARVGKSRIAKERGVFDLVYLGTLTERMLPALRTLLAAVKQLTAANPTLQLLVHLIGTSAQPAGEDKLAIRQIAREAQVTEAVKLEPRRVPYLDALRTMQDADLLLLLGSTDSHYTASKLFSCWLAQRPILSVCHAASTVNELARELGGVELVSYDDNVKPDTRVNELAGALRRIMENGAKAVPQRNESAFEPYSARGIARTYAKLFDRVIAAKEQTNV